MRHPQTLLSSTGTVSHSFSFSPYAHTGWGTVLAAQDSMSSVAVEMDAPQTQSMASGEQNAQQELNVQTRFIYMCS